MAVHGWNGRNLKYNNIGQLEPGVFDKLKELRYLYALCSGWMDASHKPTRACMSSFEPTVAWLVHWLPSSHVAFGRDLSGNPVVQSLSKTYCDSDCSSSRCMTDCRAFIQSLPYTGLNNSQAARQFRIALAFFQ